MNIQEKLRPGVAKPAPGNRSNLWNGILLIVLGTFAAGLIPILYSSTIAPQNQGNPTHVGESSLWGAFGER